MRDREAQAVLNLVESQLAKMFGAENVMRVEDEQDTWIVKANMSTDQTLKAAYLALARGDDETDDDE